MSKERNAAAALILTTLLGKTNRRLRSSAKALAAELSGKVKLGHQKSKAAEVRKGLMPNPLTDLLPRLPKGFLPQPVAAATSDGAALARQFKNDMRVGSMRVEAPPLRILPTVRQIVRSLPTMELPADVVRRVTSLLTRIKRRQDVLAAMFGRPLFSASPGSLADPARQQAHTLRFRLGVLFNKAMPAGGTRRTVLRDVRHDRTPPARWILGERLGPSAPPIGSAWSCGRTRLRGSGREHPRLRTVDRRAGARSDRPRRRIWAAADRPRAD